MKSFFRSAAVLALAASLVSGGCSPTQQLETISTAQTCAKVEDILSDMATVLLQLAVNPLALPEYEDRLRSLSSELRDIRALDAELDISVDEVADGVDQILDSTDLSNPLNISGLPSGIAKVQGSLRDVLAKCEQLVAA